MLKSLIKIYYKIDFCFFIYKILIFLANIIYGYDDRVYCNANPVTGGFEIIGGNK